MVKERLLEIDVLRIIAILIVMILVHLPQNYAYNFYMELNVFEGQFLNALSVFCSVGAFVFLSGFSLHLQKQNRGIDSKEKLVTFLKKRFLRIFPLYWLALVLFVIMFAIEGYNVLEQGSDQLAYLLTHVAGMQIVLAPVTGDPILTLWFVGLIVICYLIYPVFSYLNDYRRIIAASIGVFAFFLIIRAVFGLVEDRFFIYYFAFVAGVVTAEIKDGLRKYNMKEILVLVPGVLVGYLVFNTFAMFFYSNTILLGRFAHELLDPLRYTLEEILFMIFIIDTVIIAFVAIVLSISRSVFNVAKTRPKVITLLGYSTFCTYLFHRPFFVVIVIILTEIFQIDAFARANFIIPVLLIPVLFVISFFLQKGMDKALSELDRKLSERKRTLLQVPEGVVPTVD
ncbi:MAG: acyltransferase family protein [Candidatus Odinarchaeota archaeon]